MDKPQKPIDLLPESFGGQKENFSEDKIATGYQPDVPDILGGANLNYLLDAAGKNFKYNNAISDFVNGLPINKSITTDKNNKLIYTEYGVKVYNSSEIYKATEWVKGELDSKQVICESLIDDNKNNPLTDTTKWKKVEFGGSGSDLPLFTALATDHILEGNDAIGWALQGSLITNVYTDAVNKIKEEYNNGIPSQNPILELPEANKTINIKENTLALIPNGFNEDGTKKYTTYKYSSDFTKYTGTISEVQTYLWSTENGGCWDITEYHISDTAPVVSDRDAVWYDTKNNKIKRTDTQGVSWSDELLSLPMAKVTTSGILVDESHYGFKSIDEIYNGFEFLEILKFPYTKAKNGHRIADISQKEAVDNLFSTTGIADFYILDSTNNQFYLPRSRWFAQFTPDTNLVNNFNEAGLPDIEGTATARSFTDAGAFTTTGAFYDAGPGGFDISQHNSGGRSSILGFKASNFNSLYSNSETVQPASSNKLLYYKVGNTIVNESSIDIGNVLSELQQKANKDLSNVDTYSIQQMLIPDYSTELSITNGHTCAYPCYLRVTGAHEGATHTVNINGVKIGESNAELWGIKAFNHMNVFAYCDKGDVITFDGSPEIRIFKLKGAK